MKLAIIGSRTFTDYQKLSSELEQFSNIELIISGGAIGADSIGQQYAIEHNIPTLIFKPNWKQFGRGAGFVRNVDIVEACDIVIAFWDGISKGTKHSIDLAKKKDKVIVICLI